MPEVTQPSEKMQYKRFTHSPFSFTWNGVTANVSENGKIKITQHNIVEGEEVEDEISTSVSFIYRLASMLSATKKVTWSDTPYREDEE